VNDHETALVAVVTVLGATPVTQPCPHCGELLSVPGLTSRCRRDHAVRHTPAQQVLDARGWDVGDENRKRLTKAKRLGKAGDLDGARAVLNDMAPRTVERALELAKVTRR
jgi:hypothetical protein